MDVSGEMAGWTWPVYHVNLCQGPNTAIGQSTSPHPGADIRYTPREAVPGRQLVEQEGPFTMV